MGTTLASMAEIDIGGTKLDFVERGSGEAVLLVHGSASDHRTWDCQLERLSSRFRTIAYSRRFHRPNSRIEAGVDYSMEQHVEDLRAVLNALGGRPLHLVGHSYGAVLTLLLAIRHPALVRSLVLAEPPAITLFTSDPPKPLELLGLMLRKPLTALAIIKLGATGFAPATAAVHKGDEDAALRIFGSAVLGREAFERLSPARLAQARDNFIAAELTGSGMSPLTAADVRAVRQPVLLLTAERSPAVFHRLADGLEELLPNVERAEISAASHILYEDNPDEFAQTLQAFLAQHASRVPKKSAQPAFRPDTR